MFSCNPDGFHVSSGKRLSQLRMSADLESLLVDWERVYIFHYNSDNHSK